MLSVALGNHWATRKSPRNVRRVTCRVRTAAGQEEGVAGRWGARGGSAARSLVGGVSVAGWLLGDH